MEIKIALKNNKALCIQFGRKSPWGSSFYLVSIIIEEYGHDREKMKVINAFFIKEFFRDKRFKRDRVKI